MPVKPENTNEEETTEIDEEVENEVESVQDSEEDELIQQQILKNNQEEQKVKAAKIRYNKDSHVYTADKETGTSLWKYKEYTAYGALEDTGEFLKAMKLEKGMLYQKADTSRFNDAVSAMMKSLFQHEKVTYNKGEKKAFVTRTAKKSFTIAMETFDKESITEKAKVYRSLAFSYLTGEGNPEKANPRFVRQITERNKDGTLSTRLAYDYKAIDAFVGTFENDEDLYKHAIKNIDSRNFDRYYRDQQFYSTVDNQGNSIRRFGMTNRETRESVEKSIHDYRSFVQIRAARPWHYWFTHPIYNYFEYVTLKDIRNELLDVAEENGFKKEMEKAMASRNDNELEKNMAALENAIGPLEEGETIEPEANEEEREDIIDTTSPETRKKIEIEEEQEKVNEDIIIKNANSIEPISDVMDEDHPYKVDGYGMTESTVYLSKAEYDRIHKAVNEQEVQLGKDED